MRELVLRCLTGAMLLAGIFVTFPASPAAAAGTVGNGSPASCTESALEAALENGGLVTFSCGGDPVTIPVTERKVIAHDTLIDGDGLIALDGQNATGVFYVNSDVELRLTEIAITNANAINTSPNQGGAIYNDGGDLTLNQAVFQFNDAQQGGAIYNNDGVVSLTASTLNSNHANDTGAAIYNHEGTVEIIASTLSHNNTANLGGAIYTTSGLLTISNSTFSGNHADNLGGAVRNNASEMFVFSSTFSDNSAERGGAIATNGRVLLTNSIIANSDADGNCNGPASLYQSQGHNLSDDDTCDLTAGGDLPNTAAQLGELTQSNGGPTATHLPLPGSEAIDNALDDACPDTDQRGFARPVGISCDIGSVEVAAENSVPVIEDLCVSRITGLARAPEGDCSRYEIAVSVTGDDGVIMSCVDRISGLLRVSTGDCSRYELPLLLPAEEPVEACVSVMNASVRVPGPQGCGRYETLRVLPGGGAA